MNNSLSLLVTIILSCLAFTGCNNNSKASGFQLKGEYYYSEYANISYFLPEGFSTFILDNEETYYNQLRTIQNDSLRKILQTDYVDRRIMPLSNNFQYLYKEDTLNYTNLFINELDYFRLTDKSYEAFQFGRTTAVNTVTSINDSIDLVVTKDVFVNKSHYQKLINKGYLKKAKDTVFWEDYIISKFGKTFTLRVESTLPVNYEGYMVHLKHGDQRNKLFE
ncbi:MAG: hypothetical protein ACSHXF_08735 [Aquaticitalea sp.]